MVFELAADIAPRTCENFVKLCEGVESGNGEEEGGPLGYKGTKIHHLKRGHYLAGGDVDGAGGRAAELGADGQRFFEDESFAIPHAEKGVLSMVSHGKDRNGSQFMVALDSCHTMMAYTWDSAGSWRARMFLEGLRACWLWGKPAV